MSSPLQTVWDISNEYSKRPRYAAVYNQGCFEVSERVKEWLHTTRPCEFGYPDSFKDIFASSTIPNSDGTDRERQSIDNDVALVLYELMAGSINYCYWYGKSDVRPNGSSSAAMYALLDAVFEKEPMRLYDDSTIYHNTIFNRFSTSLINERFPMVKDRLRHLSELKSGTALSPECSTGMRYSYPAGVMFANQLARHRDEKPLEEWLSILICMFPGFGEDLFLKRASLFFMMLNRKMGWFNNEIGILPVPSDYQLPKILRHFGAINYLGPLSDAISKDELIPEGSRAECEIRSATILACKNIAERAKCSMAQVDDWIWANRKITDAPFHLTITTNY